MAKEKKLDPKDYIGKEVFAVIGKGKDACIYYGTVGRIPIIGPVLEIEETLRHINLGWDNVEIFLEGEEALKAAGLKDVYVDEVLGKRITIGTGSGAMIPGAEIKKDGKGPYVEHGNRRVDIDDGDIFHLFDHESFRLDPLSPGGFRYGGEMIRINYPK